MTDILKRYATPLITRLFLVSLISGIALFFHVGNAVFHGMHGWLSMLLIVPFGLHLWKNWWPMMNYVGRTPFTIAMAALLAAAVAFVIPSSTSGTGGPPQFALARAVLANTPAMVAPILGATPEKLVEDLRANGFAAANVDVKLTEIAAKSGKDKMELAGVLAPYANQ